MKLSDFKIGDEFSFADMEMRNRVTDIGSRVITYIRLDQEDKRNYNGPPYSIVENVADEDDLQSIWSLTRPSTGEVIKSSGEGGFDFSSATAVIRKDGKEKLLNPPSIKGH